MLLHHACPSTPPSSRQGLHSHSTLPCPHLCSARRQVLGPWAPFSKPSLSMAHPMALWCLTLPLWHSPLITGGTGPAALMTLTNTGPAALMTLTNSIIHTMGFQVAAPSPWSGRHPNQGSGDCKLYHCRCQRSRYAAAPGTSHLPPCHQRGVAGSCSQSYRALLLLSPPSTSFSGPWAGQPRSLSLLMLKAQASSPCDRRLPFNAPT